MPHPRNPPCGKIPHPRAKRSGQIPRGLPGGVGWRLQLIGALSCSATFDNQLLTGSSTLRLVRAGADNQPQLQNFRLDIFCRPKLAVIMELCSDAGSRLLTYLLCSLTIEMSQFTWSCNGLTYSSSLHQEFNRPSVHHDQQAGVQSSHVSQMVFLSLRTPSRLPAHVSCNLPTLCGAMHWLLDHYLSRVSAATIVR